MQYEDYSIKTHKIPTYEMGMRAGMVWCRLFAFGRAQTKNLVHSHTRARHIVLCIYRAPAWGKNKVAECAFMGRLRLNWCSFWRFFFRWSLRTLNSTSTFITLLNHSLDWAFFPLYSAWSVQRMVDFCYSIHCTIQIALCHESKHFETVADWSCPISVVPHVTVGLTALNRIITTIHRVRHLSLTF